MPTMIANVAGEHNAPTTDAGPDPRALRVSLRSR